jgi:hypothetical protein
MTTMLRETILGWIRHALTAAGGSLIGTGILSQADADTAIGAALTVAGIIWSGIDKYLSIRITKANGSGSSPPS